MRDKRLTHVEKTLNRVHYFKQIKYSVFLALPDVMLAQGKPLRRSTLFEELVKELLKNRFTVVSGSFREIDSRKVRVRKAHLRKRKR